MNEKLYCEHCKEEIKQTGLFDTQNKPICYGNIVHWTDGGDDLDLETRIKERWDRIAVVEIDIVCPAFRVIDSPNFPTKQYAHSFNFGNFIYKDTKKYLTVVAENEKEYFEKFKNAGECMKWVLEQIS